MPDFLIFFLIIVMPINALFSNISANVIQDYIYKGTASWTAGRRSLLIFGIFISLSIPMGYLAYLEFSPHQSGVPTTPDSYFWILILPLAIFSIVVIISYKPLRKLSVFLVVVITLSVLVSGLYFRRAVLRETRTVYFLIDSSDKTKPYLQSDIPTLLKLKVMSVPNRVHLGLAVFGTGIEGAELCEDITELVQPSPKEAATPKMDDVLTLLNNLQARNVSGVQEAIGFAITQLETQKGIHQIVVLTTGPDERCQTINRDLLNQQADSVGVSFELVIIKLDESANEDMALLEDASDRSFELASENREEELSNIIQEILNVPPAVYRSYSYGYPGQ